MNQIWYAEAPSNIALIKYMGKKSAKLTGEKNIPDNPSISLTLPHLKSRVEIEKIDFNEDLWEPLRKEEFEDLVLDAKGSKRFLEHFKFLKNEFGISGCFKIKSANNFPGDCGLASSASSFAALTKAAIKTFSELNEKPMPKAPILASYSRQGSGSSCRSFFGPWCVWSEKEVEEISFPQKRLIHMVVVANNEKKKVSSSQAHKNVSSSLLYSGRSERARARLGLLVEAMSTNNWKNAFELTWSEFWDMHALFETSQPSFGYMNESSLKIMYEAKKIWTKINDGPLVTMDAGPNVHLIFKAEQKLMAENLIEKYQNFGFKVISGNII